MGSAASVIGLSGCADRRCAHEFHSLTDEPLIRALIRAGQNGVRIDLIVRGACMLPPGLPGQTDNIRVRSIVGRFLEHTRVFYFRSGEAEEVFLSSADWMNRNMLRRIELAWPVLDPALRRRVIDECLVPYLLDERDAWTMDGTGAYRCMASPPQGGTRGAQESLMRLHAANGDTTRSKRAAGGRPARRQHP